MIYGRMSAFGVKADSRFEAAMPANDPKPTSRLCPALNQISRMVRQASLNGNRTQVLCTFNLSG